MNFARRFNCNRCGKEKKIEKVKKQGTEIGSAAAEKSKGLFSAEDWQCAKCGNVNWARRTTCNVCNAQKFTEVEERTGLGGGFNERGVVEYKQRHDSDDEYDDFGRKKKKNRRDSQKSKPQTGPKNDAFEDDEEEEEEEEEDDGDLSKYDLWGSEDNGSKAEDKSKPKAKSPRRSRSKSRSRNKRSRRSRRLVGAAPARWSLTVDDISVRQVQVLVHLALAAEAGETVTRDPGPGGAGDDILGPPAAPGQGKVSKGNCIDESFFLSGGKR